MPEPDEMIEYARAVDRMRRMQVSFDREGNVNLLAELLQVEAEVDRLTTFHLLPRTVVVDCAAEGGGL